jgi:hypothetical protein
MSQLTFSQDDANNIIRYIFDEATIRPDGMVNITALYSAYKRATGKSKDVSNWKQLPDVVESIAYLERVLGIPSSSVIESKHGVGTWVHPDLAEMYAMWCSVEYRFAVVQLIKAAKTQKVEQPRLSPSTANRAIAEDLTAIQNTLDWNPRLAQFLIDQTIDQCFSKALPATDLPIKGAAEIAESLGLPVNFKNRSQLGKFLAKQGHEIHREERLCNGQMRTINCYQVTPQVEASVRQFFN